jgi:hypothetical protein
VFTATALVVVGVDRRCGCKSRHALSSSMFRQPATIAARHVFRSVSVSSTLSSSSFGLVKRGFSWSSTTTTTTSSCVASTKRHFRARTYSQMSSTSNGNTTGRPEARAPSPTYPTFDVSPVPANPLGEGKYIRTAAALIIGYVTCLVLVHSWYLTEPILTGLDLPFTLQGRSPQREDRRHQLGVPCQVLLPAWD